MLPDRIPRDLGDLLSTYERRIQRLELKGHGFVIPPSAVGVATYSQNTAPTGTILEGSLWIDTSSGNTIYRYTSGSWVSALDPTVDQARDEAAVALVSAQDDAATVDNIVNTYYRTTAPATAPVGDLWINSSNFQLYRSDGATWVSQADTGVGSAVGDPKNASAVADGKVVTWWQFTTPTPQGFGDLWVDTSGPNKLLYRWNNFTWQRVLDWNGPLLAAIATAQATADRKVTTFYQTAAPTATATGDLWVDTDDSNKMYRWSGSQWLSVQDGTIAVAQTAATAAQTLAATKIITFYQGTAPTAKAIGDIWIDTSNNNEQKRWNGSAWVTIRDANIAVAAAAAAAANTAAGTALSAAQAAQATADGAITTYYQAAPPWANNTTQPAEKLGDLWFNTSNNQASRWNGTTWVIIQDNSIAVALAAAQSAQTTADNKITAWYSGTPPWANGASGHTLDVGDIWYNTSNKNAPSYWDGANWVLIRDLTIADAQTTASSANLAAQTAQATADGKVTTYYQAGAPTTHALGDLWVDTANGNKMYRWSGTQWLSVQDGSIATAQAAATAAQTLAGTKVITFYQNTAPIALSVGDLWVDTSNNNEPKRWSGSAWVSIRDATIAAAAQSAANANTAATGALTAAQAAQATADGAITTFYQASPPWANGSSQPAAALGDLWFNTTTNAASRWSGSTWVLIQDTSIAAALAAAQGAQTTADGKIHAFYATTSPWANGATGHTLDVGDIWYNTANKNAPSYWDGTNWTLIRDLTIADAQAAADNAQSSATSAILMDGYSSNPLFDNWPTGSTYPTGYSAWAGKTSVNVPSKELTTLRTLPYALRMVAESATVAQGMQIDNLTTGAWATMPLADYVTLTVDFYLVSGTLSGAGILLDWYNTVPTSFRATVDLNAEVPNAVVGTWYRVTKVVQKPAGFTGTFSRMAGFVMGSFNSIAATTTKTIIFDQVGIRPSTGAEVQAFNAATASSVTTLTTTVGTKVSTFYQGTTPTATATGDLWVDTSNNNELKRWTGSAWVSVRDATIAAAASSASTANTAAANALTAAQAAQATADGAITTYYQAAPPWANNTTQPSTVLGDLWFNTSNNQASRWNGTTWAIIQDNSIATALAAAQTAQTTADGKIHAFYATTRPWADGASGHTLDVGDLWYDTSDKNKPYYWAANSVWTAVRDLTIADAQLTANAKTKAYYGAKPWLDASATHDANFGDLWFDTTNQNQPYYWDATRVWLAVRDQGITAAQNTANIKNQAFYSATKPWADGLATHDLDFGDMWFDISATGKNKPYYWDSTRVWLAVRDATIADAQLSADNAQSSATAAILMHSYSSNPLFDNWATGTYPAGYALWSGVTSVNLPTKETTLLRTAPWALRLVSENATVQQGVGIPNSTTGAWATMPNADYVTVTVDFYLVSGGLAGAGILIDWYNTLATQFRSTVNLATEVPAPDLGKWYRVQKVVQKPTGFTGTFQRIAGYVMGSYSTLQTPVAKDIIFDQVSVRPSTVPEVAAFNAAPASSVTALTGIVNTKVSTYYAATAPVSPVVGDLWVIPAATQPDGTVITSNLMKRWDGTNWVGLPAGNDAIATNSVTQDHLVDIVNLQTTTITSRTKLDSTTTTGAGVELSPEGFFAYDVDGNIVVQIVNDPEQPNIFKGDAEIDHLTVQTLTTLLATQLSQGAVFSMQYGVASPTQPPGISVGYDTVKFTDDGLWPSRTNGFTWDGTNYFIMQNVGGGQWFLERWSTAGKRTASMALNSVYTPYGMAWDGTSLKILIYNENANRWQLMSVNNTFTTTTFDVVMSGTTAQLPEVHTSANGANMCYDFAAGQFVIVQSRTSNGTKLRIQRFSVNNTTGAITWGTTIDTTFTYANNIGFCLCGNFDLGSPHIMYGTYGISGVQCMTTAGVADDQYSFPHGSTFSRRGLVWSGLGTTTGTFQMWDSSGLQYIYEPTSGNRWTATTDSTWYAAYSWTNGTNETITTTPTKFTMSKRAHVKISTPVYPLGVTAGMIYVSKGTTVPTNSTVSLTYQGNTSGSGRSFIVDNAVFAPPTNKIVSGFGSGVAASITSAALDTAATPKSLIQLNGDGSWRLGPLSGDATGAMVTSDPTKLGVPITNTLAADFSTKSTSYVSAGFSLLGVTPGTYLYKVRGSYQSSATTTGIGIRTGGTATTSALNAEVIMYSGANSSNSPVFTRVLSAQGQTAASTTGVQTANSSTPFTIEGTFTVTTTGSISTDIVSQDGVGTVKMMAGSMMTAYKIA